MLVPGQRGTPCVERDHGGRVPWSRKEFRAAEKALLIPRANCARGKVLGALPRTPARGKPPETPAPFPFASIFHNVPGRPGCAQQNLFNPRKDFPPPRPNRAPGTAADRCEDLPAMKGKGGKCQGKPSAARRPVRPSAGRPRAVRNVCCEQKTRKGPPRQGVPISGSSCIRNDTSFQDHSWIGICSSQA
jgi:hypothetical protein